MARTQLLEPRNPVHLYRHLLREASYLPPVCRPFITSRIQTRFRKHRGDPSPKPRLRQAHHDVRFLAAANAGDRMRMRRVLLFAFGRIGVRRQQLMEALRRHEPPADTAELAAELRAETEAATSKRRADWLDKWNTAKLLVLARSQGQQSLTNSPRPDVKQKQLNPAAAVPAFNIWGRPLAVKAARGKTRRFWIDMANRIVPPLAKGEWELLKSLAKGQVTGPEWDVPKRRAAAHTGDVGGENTEWMWEKYATEPVRSIERQRSRRFKGLSGIDDDGDGVFGGPAIGMHTYTTRSWRRLYAEIWQLTATMEKQKDVPNKWDIQWGTARLQPTTSSRTHSEFFEGVDSRGLLPAHAAAGKPKPAKTR